MGDLLKESREGSPKENKSSKGEEHPLGAQ